MDDRIGTAEDRRDLERAKLAEEFFVDELPPRPPPRPLTDVEAFDEAMEVLLTFPPALSGLGRSWRTNAAAHLAERFDTELHGGVRRWSGDAQALALLKTAARDLREAADALYGAAVKFRERGQGWDANRTYHAAVAASRAADALDPPA